MRKLLFTLDVNMPGTLSKSIDISTHRGSRLTIRPKQTVFLNVTDDEMSNNDLLNWYKSRYSRSGLRVRLVKDETPKVALSNPVSVQEVPVEKEPVKEPESITAPQVAVVLDQVEVPSSNEVKESVKKPLEASVNDTDTYLTDMLFQNVVSPEVSTSEPVAASVVEPKLHTGTKVDEMTYFEMIQFAKDNNIEVGGRAKELYVQKLTEWFRQHPEK